MVQVNRATFFLVLQIYAFIFKTKCLEIFFLEKNKCSLDCLGSAESPFPNLFYALSIIENSFANNVTEIVLKLRDETLILEETGSEHKNFFYICQTINLTISPENPVNKTRITLNNSVIPFSFFIRGGGIKFVNIDFEGSLEEVAPIFSPEDFYLKRNLSGFLDINSESKVDLSLINCGFYGIYLTAKKSHLFSSLIYAKTQKNSHSKVKIEFQNLKINRSTYPQGVLYVNAPSAILKKKIVVQMTNIEIIDHSNSNFIHWNNKYHMAITNEDYFDFCFILNNTLLRIENINIINSSRIILANCYNDLNISKIKVANCFGLKLNQIKAPELIYLINSNNFSISFLYIINSTVYSYDDMLDPRKRDYPLVNSSLYPSTLLNFEKNQALFAFGLYNKAFLKNIYIGNTVIIKNDNYIFSIFNAELKNIITIQNFTIDTLTLDTESKFGILSILFINCFNEVMLRDGYFNDLAIYGYASLLFGSFIKGNNITAANMNFLRAYTRTKSNKGQINIFTDGLNYNPSFVFVNNSEMIKLAGILFFFIENNIQLNYFYVREAICLYGCVVSVFYKNIIYINGLETSQATSEVFSSVIALAFSNTFFGRLLFLEESRANSGVIFSRTNFLSLEKCKFLLNRGMGAFGYIINHVGGNIVVSLNCVLIIKYSIFANGNADKSGGGISMKEYNNVQIDLCIFIENESSSAFSSGGGIYSNRYNKISIKRSQFFSNYGTYGGVLYGELSNRVIMNDCLLEENQGEVAAVLFFNNSNFLSMKNNHFIRNQGFVSGGLIVVSGMDQIVLMNSLLFLGNQAPVKGYMIEMNENNSFLIEDAIVDYDATGNGNFFLLSENNNFTILRMVIANIPQLDIFIHCKKNNNLNLIQTLIRDQRWLDTFILSEKGNILNVIGADVSNITVLESASGFVHTSGGNILKMKNCSFDLLNGKKCMILKADYSNDIKIEGLTLKSFKISDNGTCFSILDSNYIRFYTLNVENFLGFSNDVFLFSVGKNNRISIRGISLLGLLSMEQVWNSTSVLKIFGDQNILNISDSLAKSYNPDVLKVEKLLLLQVVGYLNIIRLENSTIEIKNFLSFLIAEAKSIVFINKINFKSCEIYGNLVQLTNESNLFCKSSIFHKNNLKKSKSFFQLDQGTSAIYKRITCNTNDLFLNSSATNFFIYKSTFINHYGPLAPASNPLFSCANKSLSIFMFVEIFLRQNNQSSTIISTQSALSFVFCTFGFNRGLYGGVINLREESEMILDRNKIIVCEALLGGVILFENSAFLLISSNIFYYNKAMNRNAKTKDLGKGGCIYAALESSKIIKENLFIRDNTIHSNGADIGGFIYFHDPNTVEFIAKTNFLLQNRIVGTKVRYYGTIFATKETKTKLIKGEDLSNEAKSSIFIQEKVPFSVSLPNCLFQLVNFDYFNQTAIGAEILLGKKLDNISSNFEIDFRIHNGFYCFSSITPKSRVAIEDLTIQGAGFQLKTSHFSSLIEEGDTLDIYFKVGKCQRGEYFDLKMLQCISCQANFFSFDKEFIEPSSCKSCLLESFNCYGGFNLTPKAGFWRSDVDSINFLKCPNPKACLGDINLKGPEYQLTVLYEDFNYGLYNGICELLHEGILCDKCQKGNTKVGGLRCSPCDGLLSIFLMILKILFRVLLYYYTVYKAVMMSHNVKNNKLPSDLVYSNFLLKIIILHFQFLKFFLGFPFTFPPVLIEVLNLLSFSISSGAEKVLNLDCFFEFDPFPTSYIYCLINIVAPLLVVSSLYIFIHDEEHESRTENSTEHRLSIVTLTSPKFSITSPGSFKMTFDMAATSFMFKFSFLPYFFIISLMLSYDEIISLLMKNFSSININSKDSPDYRSVSDYEINYYSSRHQNWIYFFALPSAFFIGGLIPAYIIFKIYQAKRNGNLKRKDVLLRFGYFFFAYDEKLWFYETVYIFRKLFLISMDAFFLKIMTVSSIYNPLTFLISICFFYTGLSILTVLNKPYKQNLYPILNKMENLTLSIQGLTSWIGCFILSLKEEQEVGLYIVEALYIFGFTLGALINIFMFALWWYYYWKLSVKNKFVIFIRTTVKKLKNLWRRLRCKRNLPPIIIRHERHEDNKTSFKLTLRTPNQAIEDDEDVPEINGEGKNDICISPHYSTRWHLRTLENDKEKSYKKFSKPFVKLINSDPDPRIMKSWVEYIWQRFENKSDLDSNQFPFVRILNLNLSRFRIKNPLKKLCKNKKKSPHLEIALTLHSEVCRLEDIWIFPNINKALLSSLKYDLNPETNEVDILLFLKIKSLDNLDLHSTQSLDLFNSSSNNTLSLVLSLELDIYLADFVELVEEEISSQQEIYYSLLSQGINYNANSKILSFKIENNLYIQLVRSEPFLDNKSKELFYYYREMETDTSEKDEKELVPFLSKFSLLL